MGKAVEVDGFFVYSDFVADKQRKKLLTLRYSNTPALLFFEMLTKRTTEKQINPDASASGFAIVCARYNARYTDAMLGAALDKSGSAHSVLSESNNSRILQP